MRNWVKLLLLSKYYRGGGNGNALQCSCRENPMDRRACRATVHGVAESQTQLSTHAHRRASQGVPVVKNMPASAGNTRDWRFIPGLGRSPEGGHGNPLQYSCLENPMVRASWLVQTLSHVQLFTTPWTAARQTSLSITNSRSSLKHMSIESVMPSDHLILCRPLLLLPSIFPSIRVFSNESALRIMWPK